eukprot:m.211900 g.211900  ORF g.211900 m.211900 type:complete len:60 (-) comp19030_c0_seq26:1278-1457(-)
MVKDLVDAVTKKLNINFHRLQLARHNYFENIKSAIVWDSDISGTGKFIHVRGATCLTVW